MIRDQLEAFDRQRHGRVYECRINIGKLWRRIWGPKTSDIEAKLKQAKRDQAAYEAWFSKPTQNNGYRGSKL